MKYLPRIVDKEIDELMEIMGAILIEGCKWCGKSTTGLYHAKSVIEFQNPDRKQEYDNILELSPNTDICKMLDSMKRDKSSIIRATILCKDEKQKHIIETRNIQHDSIIISDYNRVSLKDYGTIFVKDIKDLDKYRIVEGKTIYVANYGFNILMDPDKVNPLIPIEVLEKYGNTNEFYIYSVYTLDPRKMPKG